MKLTILNEDYIIIKFVDSPYEKQTNEIITNYETHHQIGRCILDLKPKTNKEKIADGEIVIDNKTTFYNEDTDTIITLNENQKYVDGKVVEKTIDDLLGEGKITIEEYNKQMIENRVNSYKEITDPLTMEIIQEVLYATKEQFPAELKEKIEQLIGIKADIKLKYSKVK